jgi:hypothetical protein
MPSDSEHLWLPVVTGAGDYATLGGTARDMIVFIRLGPPGFEPGTKGL